MSVLSPPPIGLGSIAVSVSPDRTIGALWRRLLAALIDATIVGVIAFLIALPFFETFSRLGAWGRLVGFCLAIPYYGLLNSRIGSGQTLGKRFMRLQVVNALGETIPFSKALLRSAFLGAPFFLNLMTLPLTRTPKFVFYLIGIIVFGLGGITIYLVLFNRRTRQGVHDLVAGSYVADAVKKGALRVEPMWKGHWVVIGALIVAGIIGGRILEGKILKLANFPVMFADVRLIEGMEGVQSAGISDLTWTSWPGPEKKTIYVVNVFWTGKKGEEEAFANRVASQILQHDAQVMERNVLRIAIVRGYDLGIAHAEITHHFDDTPANWKTKLCGGLTKESSAPERR
jgi:uncharacterized RDD family membrane protein YckC